MKTLIQKDTYTSTFIAALFTIVETWKQLTCPSIDDWFKKMWCINTVDYDSAIKKNEILRSAKIGMDLRSAILSEANQTEKDKHNMISLTCRN